PDSRWSGPEELTGGTPPEALAGPATPGFTWANDITLKAVESRGEERGSVLLDSRGPAYEPVLETHDSGQAPQKGGLLYAKYGKGIYIYNAYAFYRELPEGVPGAYRIFANMLSLAKNPGR